MSSWFHLKFKVHPRCSMFPQNTILFWGWVIFHYMYTVYLNLLTHSSVDGRLGCFCSLTMLLVNIHILVFVLVLISIIFVYARGSIAGSYDNSVFNFLRNELFSKADTPFILPYCFWLFSYILFVEVFTADCPVGVFNTIPRSLSILGKCLNSDDLFEVEYNLYSYSSSQFMKHYFLFLQ